MSRRRKLWRRSVGERPCTVTVFERRPDGPLTLRWWTGEKYEQEALGHSDREKALAKALETSAKMMRGEQATKAGETILARLFLEYETHRTPRKSRTEQEADARRIELWTRFLGAERPVSSINLAAWEAFIDARMSGEIDSRGVTVGARIEEWEVGRDDAEVNGESFARPKPGPRPIRARAVEADLQWLRLVVGWGMEWRDRNGRPLVVENPLRGYKAPREKNPRRPVASTDRLGALLAVTDQVMPDLTDLLTIVAETGRRLSACLGLRQDDIDLAKSKEAPFGSIRWRADTDKAGREAVVPMNPVTRAAVQRIRERRPAIGSAYLFPSPKDDAKPMRRDVADRMLRKAEKLSGLPPQPGSLWHAYRRAWATARKHLPAVDVAKAGGWATVSVVTDIYQQADQETTLAVVLGGAEIREVKA